MSTLTKAPIGGAAKALLVLFVLLGVFRLLEFVFFGQQMRSLLAGVGFVLLAYGFYKNGFSKVTVSAGGRYATLLGIILVGIAFALRFLG